MKKSKNQEERIKKWYNHISNIFRETNLTPKQFYKFSKLFQFNLYQMEISLWKNTKRPKIPKSGDLSLTGDYRGIALSPIAAKIKKKMLLNRILHSYMSISGQTKTGFERKARLLHTYLHYDVKNRKRCI